MGAIQTQTWTFRFCFVVFPMTWHQNQQQLGNNWECCNLSPKHESQWGSSSRKKVGEKEYSNQADSVGWWYTYAILTICWSNLHFSSSVDPAAATRRQVAQTLCTSPGFQLIHVSGLRTVEIESGFNGVKGAVALPPKKLDTTFFGNFQAGRSIKPMDGTVCRGLRGSQGLTGDFWVQTSMLHCGQSWP